MKFTSKTLGLLALSVVILLVIVMVVFYLFGERVIEVGVETAATKALGVGVYVGGVKLSVLKGAVEVKDIIVSNPAGYTYKNLLELDRTNVKVNIGSLLEDTVHIKELKLDGINLVIEQKVLSNNLQDVINSISDKEQPEAEPSGKKLHIDNLELTGIKVKAKLLPVPGRIDTVTLDLAPIRMSNLGADNKLGIAILSEKIMLAITEGVARQGVGILPDEIVSTMKLTLDKTVDVGKAAAEEGKKLIDTGKDVGADIIEGFKGLLKPNKEK